MGGQLGLWDWLTDPSADKEGAVQDWKWDVAPGGVTRENVPAEEEAVAGAMFQTFHPKTWLPVPAKTVDLAITAKL